MGISGVGKTALINRLVTGNFSTTSPTVAIDVRICEIPAKGKGEPTILTFHDTAGQERFRSISKPYFRGADVVLVVVSSRGIQKDLVDCLKWLNEIESEAQEAKFILVRTQIDLVKNRHSGRKRVEEDDELFPVFGKEENLGETFFDVSSMEGWGIEELKNYISEVL
uniref:Uncharacterized protein n=1 Tax=Arcella intermedia TaxID=1963864 RepID=A0A6B2LMA5_9EUKA